MSPTSLQPLALPWPKLARAALFVLPLVAHAAQACSPLQHGHPINKDKRSPGDPSEIEAVVSNVFESAPAETLPKLLADPETLLSTQPHGELPHVGALTATSGAPAQFQLAGRKRSQDTARLGLDDSGHYLAPSSAAAAHGGAHSFPLEHGEGGQPAQTSVLTEPVWSPRDNTYFAPRPIVQGGHSSHQEFPPGTSSPPTTIEHVGSSSSLRGARTTPRSDDATELTKAAHGSASSHLPGTKRKVKLTKPSEDQIELAFKKLLASPTILEGLTNGVIFDIDEVRLDAARKTGVEDDARKLLAEGVQLMELRSLLERSIRYYDPRSKWYVATDEELRAWLGRVYSLRDIIFSFPRANGRTFGIESHMDVDQVVREFESLRRIQIETRRRRHKGELPSDQQLSGIVGPFQTRGAVENPFVFGSYIFRVLRDSDYPPAGRKITVLPFEPFFNDDELVGKLPIVAPGALKDEKPPARLDQSGVLWDARRGSQGPN